MLAGSLEEASLMTALAGTARSSRVRLRRTCAIGWMTFGVAVVGGVAANGNPQWWRFSICALGMTVSPAPWVFNTGMLAVACAFGWLAVQTNRALSPHVHEAGLTARQLRALTGAVLLVSASLVVLALVPYDIGPLQKSIHNVAGWGSGWVVAASMVLAPRHLRVLDRRFRTHTALALAVFMSFFAGFEVGLLTYAEAEIGAILVAAVWTTAFFGSLEEIAAPHACAPLDDERERQDSLRVAT
jgi:hypothetical protein